MGGFLETFESFLSSKLFSRTLIDSFYDNLSLNKQENREKASTFHCSDPIYSTIPHSNKLQRPLINNKHLLDKPLWVDLLNYKEIIETTICSLPDTIFDINIE